MHSIEIAAEMGFTKPSICRAIKLLRENGYLEIDTHNIITLLEKEKALAERTCTRHKALTQLFTLIGVDKETPGMDVCKFEHNVSELAFQKLMLLADTRSKAEKMPYTAEWRYCSTWHFLKENCCCPEQFGSPYDNSHLGMENGIFIGIF